MKRDDSVALDAEQATIAARLAEAGWYRALIDPGRLRQLTDRTGEPTKAPVFGAFAVDDVQVSGGGVTRRRRSAEDAG